MDKQKKPLFDYCIGNPPYQDGKQQIYPAFYQNGKEIAQCVDMIFPVGWQEPKNANGLKRMNTKEVKEDSHIVFINNVEDVFPSVSGAKYTNIILWDRNHDNKLNGCQKVLTNGENPQTIKLLCDVSDIQLPSELTSVLTKVKANDFVGIDTIIYIQNNLILDVVYEDYPEVEAVIGSEGKDKRFERNIFDKLPAFVETQQAASDIKTIGTVGNKRTWRYIDEKYVDKSHANLKKYKLIISAAASDKFGSSLSDFVIGKPNEAYTRSFIGFGAYSSDLEVRNIEKYLKTKFARALLYTLKFGRMNNKDVWQNVPLQDFTKDSDIDWSKSIKELDEQLYDKYHLSDKEIEFIEDNVKEMT